MRTAILLGFMLLASAVGAQTGWEPDGPLLIAACWILGGLIAMDFHDWWKTL